MAAIPMAPEIPPSPASFVLFYRSFSGDALRYARAIIGPEGAEDACQEAWLRAWRAWGAAEAGKEQRWLLTIVRNCCFEAQRRKRVQDAQLDDPPHQASAPDDAALATVELARLWAGLALSPALRETLWLREVLALPYAEIARRQGIPIGTVMSRLHSARLQARRQRSA